MHGYTDTFIAPIAFKEEPLPPSTTFLLHELDLGQHTLLLLSDGSMEVLVTNEQMSALSSNGIQLDREETYRLFISFHEQFRQQGEGHV